PFRRRTYVRTAAFSGLIFCRVLVGAKWRKSEENLYISSSRGYARAQSLAGASQTLAEIICDQLLRGAQTSEPNLSLDRASKRSSVAPEWFRRSRAALARHFHLFTCDEAGLRSR